jgi:ribosome-associated protein
MSNTYEVEIEQQPIELYKLLKIADLVSGGGEAKMLISEGHVLLNGEAEYQKRKKVYSGDVIEFNGDFIELTCHSEPLTSEQLKAQKQASALESKANLAATNHKASANKNKQSKHPKKASPKNKSKNGSNNSSNNSSNKAPVQTPSEQKPTVGGRRSIKF